MLATREDIFIDYDQLGFESAFTEYFTIKKSEPIYGSKRVLYLMSSRRPHALQKFI